MGKRRGYKKDLIDRLLTKLIQFELEENKLYLAYLHAGKATEYVRGGHECTSTLLKTIQKFIIEGRLKG